MLRSVNSLTKTLRCNYNNYNDWRRYQKNYPIQAEPKNWKQNFKEGDSAEFAYDNKIIWPEQYKPWKPTIPFEYVLGLGLIFVYIDCRTDKVR